MEFVLNGVHRILEADIVIGRMRDVRPEPVREHAVEVGGVAYPVKQVFERASGVSRSQFTSQTALRHLRALGFPIVAGDPPRRVWCGATSATSARCCDRGRAALALGGKRAGRVR